MGFIIADGTALFAPCEFINEELSLELIYLGERGSLLQSRFAHSLLDEVNYYTWKIDYALRGSVFSQSESVVSFFKTILRTTYAESSLVFISHLCTVWP